MVESIGIANGYLEVVLSKCTGDSELKKGYLCHASGRQAGMAPQDLLRFGESLSLLIANVICW